MDIIDPIAYYRHLGLLSNTVAQLSEFKRCGGRYERADEHTWDQDYASDTDVQDIPDWMWSAFGSLAVGLLPDQFGSVEAILANLWKDLRNNFPSHFEFQSVGTARVLQGVFQSLAEPPWCARCRGDQDPSGGCRGHSTRARGLSSISRVTGRWNDFGRSCSQRGNASAHAAGHCAEVNKSRRPVLCDRTAAALSCSPREVKLLAGAR